MVCLSLLLCLIVAVSTKKVVTDTESKHDRPVLRSRPDDHMARIEKLLVNQQKRQQRLESENHELMVTNHGLRKDLSTLTAKHLQLEATVSLMQRENHELKDAVFELKAENQDFRVTVSKLISQIERPNDNSLQHSKIHDNENSLALLTVLDGDPARKKHVISKSAKDSLHGYILKRKSLVPRQNITSSHDVTTRSDDMGPLEPVVTQMAQRLTAIEADLRASKADVQTLRNAHSTDIQALKSVDQQHSQAIQQAASSVYTRWGHSACPASNSIVYSGVMGGSWYGHSGSATNYLCLSLSPVFGEPKPPPQFAYLYGAEFQTHDQHYEQDPVCAVCRSPRPTVVMVPGTNVCWSGWTLEYRGYLMAGDSQQDAGTEFICMDSALESRIGGGDDRDGKLLLYTKAECGSLPCPPYANEKTVLCAVCSQ